MQKDEKTGGRNDNKQERVKEKYTKSCQKMLKDSKSCQKLPKDVKGCQKFPKDA